VARRRSGCSRPRAGVFGLAMTVSDLILEICTKFGVV